MKKVISLVLILCMCFSLTACLGDENDPKNQNAKTVSILVPNSFFKTFDASKRDLKEEITDLGPNFYTDVDLEKDGVLVTMTPEQRTSLIEYYAARYEDYVDDIEALGKGCGVAGSDSYKEIVFVVDASTPKKARKAAEDAITEMLKNYAINQNLSTPPDEINWTITATFSTIGGTDTSISIPEGTLDYSTLWS